MTASSGGSSRSVDGNGLEALRAEEARGRRARTPDRIGEHAPAIDLDEHRRMPEPGGAQAAAGRSCPGVERIQRRQRRRRHAPIAAADEVADRRHRRRPDRRAEWGWSCGTACRPSAAKRRCVPDAQPFESTDVMRDLGFALACQEQWRGAPHCQFVSIASHENGPVGALDPRQ